MDDTREALARPLQDFLKKVSGSDGEKWLAAFKRFLRKENPWEVSAVDAIEPREFPTWRTLKLGTGLRTATDFIKALADAGFKIGDWSKDILGKPEFDASVATTETEVELVILSVAKLGFKNGATLAKIYARAKELGLDLCPAEVGPQLRLQYAGQPMNEWSLIAMEPIRRSDGYLHVFNVEHDDNGRWLGSRYGGAGVRWGADGRFVFLRRK